MHAPDPGPLTPHGWSPERVLENWRHWIDLYAELFPEKNLILVLSQMYPGENQLPERVAEYFLSRIEGRAILQTDQINGREDALPQSGEICRRFHERAPHCHEMAGSFREQPERQGSAAMTMYNFVKMGNPLYLQLWRRDCDDPTYARDLLDAWKAYGHMPPEEIKARLQRTGLYVEKSSWDPAKFRG